MARKFKSKVTEHNYYVKMINKNLSKLAKEMPESKALERYSGEFQPITTQNPNKRVLAKALKQVKAIYKSGVTSLSHQKRSMNLAIQTLKEQGIDYVDRRNFNSFFTFLDDARARGLGSIYSSTQLIEAFKAAKDKGLTKSQILANIEYWAQKYVKYDKEGKIIEPDEYQPIKTISGKRLENYRAKARARARREAKGDY